MTVFPFENTSKLELRSGPRHARGHTVTYRVLRLCRAAGSKAREDAGGELSWSQHPHCQAMNWDQSVPGPGWALPRECHGLQGCSASKGALSPRVLCLLWCSASKGALPPKAASLRAAVASGYQSQCHATAPRRPPVMGKEQA